MTTTPAKKRDYSKLMQTLTTCGCGNPYGPSCSAPGILIRVFHPRHKRPALKSVSSGDAAC